MIIRTLVSRLFFILFLLLFSVPLLIIIIMPEKWRRHNRFIAWLMYIFYVGTLKCSFLPISVRGQENIPNSPVIIASNHQSSLDIPLIGSLLGVHPHVWLARSELMETWVLRFILPYFTVIIDVNSPMKSMRSLRKIIELVEGERCHLVIFPEGQRYDDNEVHEFFGGFVTLAKKIGRPVVPVRIFNASKAYERGAFWVKFYPITVVVGEPLTMQEGETDNAFKQRVYDWFMEQQEK